MRVRTDEPFPISEVRDLLGIVRALHRAEKADGAPDEVLEHIETVGRKLLLALELAGNTPRSLGGRAAWAHAEEACAELGAIIERPGKTGTLLEAARTAVVKRRSRS